MIPSFLKTILLLGWLVFGSAAVCCAGAQSVVVEPQRKLQPAGPGRQPFDVTRHIVPLSEIVVAAPRDAIPALSQPRFVTAEEVRRTLKDSDRVVGVLLNGEAKAYPVRILNWHEAVNDVVGGRAVLVSW